MEYLQEEGEETLKKEIDGYEGEENKDDLFVSAMNKKDFDIEELEDLL